MKRILVFLFCALFAGRAYCGELTGYFVAAGLPLIAGGIGLVLVGTSMQPQLDYQGAYLTRLNQESAPAVTRDREGNYYEALRSKQTTLKTAGYVFLAGGSAAILISILDHQRRVRVSARAGSDSFGLLASVNF